MQTLTSRTGQNRPAQATTAGLGDRLLAFIVDAFILTAYTIIVTTALITADVEAVWTWVIFVIVPLCFYSLICEIAMGGQSPGKRAMRLRVVSLEGDPVSAGQSFIRWAFLIVGLYFFSGVIAAVIIFVNKKGQRLGDIVAGSKVVKIMDHAVVGESHVVTIPSVRLLEMHDIELIQRALNAQRDFENPTPVLIVSEKIKSMLGVASELPPSEFLSTIVKDFKHLSLR
jgi:uncharacterized RDD family membrane protein YckC